MSEPREFLDMKHCQASYEAMKDANERNLKEKMDLKLKLKIAVEALEIMRDAGFDMHIHMSGGKMESKLYKRGIELNNRALDALNKIGGQSGFSKN
jgi:hypothetical protein